MSERSRGGLDREVRWRQVLKEQRRSGLGQRAFCERRGLSLSTFQYWKRRLLDSGGEKSSWGEYSVEPAVPASLEPGLRDPVWECEIELSRGVVVRVAPGVSASRVGELLAAASVRG